MQEAGQTDLNRVEAKAGPAVRAFVSYAHDDKAHVDRVREFCDFLRENGIDAQSDLPAGEQRQDWAAWSEREVNAADRVLVIASPEYKRRAGGHEGASGQQVDGPDVRYEARLIRERLYANQAVGLRTVLPVVLPGCCADDIPGWLMPSSTTHYTVSECTIAGAVKLLRVLTGQPYEVEGRLGAVPLLPPRSALDDDAALLTSAEGDMCIRPVPPDGAAPQGNEAIMSALVKVSDALAAIKPLSSWKPGRWMLESTSLRMLLVALDAQISQLPVNRESSALTVRQAIRLKSRITEIRQLAGNIKESLNSLMDDSLPPEARDRECSVFVTNSTGLQHAAVHVQRIIHPSASAERNG